MLASSPFHLPIFTVHVLLLSHERILVLWSVPYSGETNSEHSLSQKRSITVRGNFQSIIKLHREPSLEASRRSVAQKAYVYEFRSFITVFTTRGPKHGRPETCGRPGQANNLALLKTEIIYTFFGLGQDWQNFLKARAQTADNFREILSRMETRGHGCLSLVSVVCVVR